MPRKRSSIGIAAGKLLIAIQNESASNGDKQVLASKIAKRAQTLLQAAHQDYVVRLLDGKTVAEYLDSEWVAAHASVQECVDALTSELNNLK